MSGARFTGTFALRFTQEGENAHLATLRKVETSQQRVQKAIAKTGSTTTAGAKAQTAAATSAGKLEAAQKEVAASSERLTRELLEQSAAAARAAQAADTSTREGRAYAKQQTALARDLARSAGASDKATRSTLENAQASDRASSAGGRYTRTTRDQDKATRRLSGGLATAARRVAALVAVYASWHQVKAAVDNTNELAKATSGLNRNFDIGVRAASRWAAVAVGREIDNKSLVLSFTTLARRIEDAAEGSDTALAPFKALGVTQKDLDKTSGDFQGTLLMLADAFGKAEGSSTRQAAAQKLLGRGYATILPMFADGAKGLKEQFHWADKFGTVLGSKTLDKQMELVTAQRKSKVAWLGIQIAVAKGITPALITANEELQAFSSILNSPRLTRDQKFDRIGDRINRIVDMVSDRLPRIIERAAPQIAESGGKLTIALLTGMANGFTNMSILGKVFTAAAMIRLVGGRGALLGIGRAIGSTMGIGVGQGMASTTVAAGTGTAAGRVGGIRGALAGAGTAGLFTAAGVAQVQQLSDAFVYFGKSVEDPIGRLDQLNQKAGTWQATSSDLLEKSNLPIFRDLGGLIGGGEAKEQGDRAERLKGILDEINSVGRIRAAQLRAEGSELLRNLDLTESQKKAIEGMLNNPARSGIQNRAIGGIADLRSGDITRSQDIARVVQRTQNQINAGWARGSEGWRKTTARNMGAQVQAIRAGMAASVISTKKGREQIARILRERKLVTGQDPVGIATAYAKSWRRTHEITPRQIKRIKSDLGKMPAAAREKAIDTMQAMAEGLNRQGKLPERELSKFKSAITARFGRARSGIFAGVSTSAEVSFKRVGDAVSAGMDRTVKATQNGGRRVSAAAKQLAADTERQTRRVRKAYTGMPAPVSTALHSIADYSNETASAFGSNKRISLAFRHGGRTPRRFQDGGVLARVSSGEGLRFPDGRWAMVPGPRVAADNVLTTLPPETEVYTGSGLGMLAAGFSRSEALAHQLPHFATGGKVPHGRLSGGATVAREAGQKSIDSSVGYARKWIDRLQPLNSNKWVDSHTLQVASILEKRFGIRRSSTYRDPAHNAAVGGVPGSLHTHGSPANPGAIDFTPPSQAALAFAQSNIAGLEEAMIHDVGSGLHLHLGFFRRGGIARFRKGGYSPGIWKGSRLDRVFPKSDGYSGYRVPPYAIRAMAQYYGLPGVTMEQITRGESMGRAGLDIPDPPGRSRSLYAIHEQSNPEFNETKLRNPVYASWAARKIVDKMGGSPSPNIWHGDKFVTGWNLNYDASAEKIRRIAKRFGARGGGDEDKGTPDRTVTIVRDDLRPMGAKQARRRVPRMARGFQADAFSSAFDAGRLTHSIRKAARDRARVKITRTQKTIPGRPGKTPAGGTDKSKIRTMRRMQAYGDRVAAKRMPYQYGGGHGTLGVGTPSFDCSGYVSGILGAGGFIDSPMVVAQGTGLYTLGKAGTGKLFTWGVRGTSAQGAHTMIRVGKKFYEASSEGVGRRGGWSGAFKKRHIPGYRTGGKAGRRRPGIIGSNLASNGMDAVSRMFPFGGGRHAADTPGGIGHGTGKQLSRLFTAGNRENKQVQAALTRLGATLSRAGKFSINSIVRLQKGMERVIKRTIDPRGPGGRKVTKAEAAMIRRARAVIDLTQGALGARAGQRNIQANRIAAKGEQYRFRRDLGARRLFLDPSSVEGIRHERATLKGEQNYLEAKRKQQRKALAIARKAGDEKTVAKMKAALLETNNAIAENVVSQAERAREAILAVSQRKVDVASYGVAASNLFYERFQLEQRLAGTYEGGGQSRADFITSRLIPMLNTEIQAMTDQLKVLTVSGTAEQQREQTLAIWQKNNEILQLQLEAQEQIQENTDPTVVGGSIAFQYGGETFTDQLLLMGNGS